MIWERLGEWNPQLFRELKGKLKPRNLLLVAGAAFISQLLLCLFFASRIPAPIGEGKYHLWNNTGQVWEISWELWSLDIFTTLSLLGIFMLLVLGTHMLISDLAREERQGTLDFIRFSPQSAQSILWGKILGVPILLYLFAGLALPLHLASGLAGGISLGAIAGFYLVVLVSCPFCYSTSAAFLLTLLTSWRKELLEVLPWLLSLLVFVFVSCIISNVEQIFVKELYDEIHITNLNFWKSIGIVLAICSEGNYWIWQAFKRCFHNPNGTSGWSKAQRLRLFAYFTLIVLGFVLILLGLLEQTYNEPLAFILMLLLIFNVFVCVFVAVVCWPVVEPKR